MVPSRQQLDDQRRSHFIPRSRMHVVPNGVDTRTFHPRDVRETRAKLGLGPEPIVVSVGRLEREKGVHTAVEAIASVAPPTRLVVVGDGAERAALHELAAERGIADRVTFLGAQPTDMVADHLAAADAFVFATERDEGAPLVLVEAMASGIPVIATDIEQIAEVADRNGVNGFLVPFADVRAVADTVSAIVADPDLGRRVGASGRERILGEYTIERMVERCVAVYELAIRRHAAPGPGSH